MLPTSRPARTATATMAATLTLGAAAPALAAGPPSVDQWKVGQTAAGVSWVEEDRGDSSGRPGNVHMGGLFVESYDGSSVLSAGSLADWDCPDGAMPWDDEGRACTLVTQYEALDGEVTLHHDRRAGTARVTGTVTFFDLAGEEPAPWTAPVDLTWTTQGGAVRTHDHVVELSSTFRFVAHEQVQTWQVVTAAGTVGSMVVGDEDAEVVEQVLWHSDRRFVIWERSAG